MELLVYIWAFELFSSFLYGYLRSFFFVKSLKWSLFIFSFGSIFSYKKFLKWSNKPKTYTSSFSCRLGYLVSIWFDVKYFHVKQFTYFSLFLFGCIKGEYSNIFHLKCIRNCGHKSFFFWHTLSCFQIFVVEKWYLALDKSRTPKAERKMTPPNL